jgi:hypothetical protein
LRDIPAALAETLFLLVSPAFISNRFSGQVDYRINAVEVALIGKPLP